MPAMDDTEDLERRLSDAASALASARGRVAELEAALIGVATRTDGDELPCWCDDAPASGLYVQQHARYCLAARAALAPAAASGGKK